MKEEYIGIFLTMCSEYIDKIIDSRRHVRRLLRDGRVDELRKEYSPTDGDSRELEEFYRNFDTTFRNSTPRSSRISTPWWTRRRASSRKRASC